MGLPFNITNPGIYIPGLLTSQEAQLVTELAGLTYASGDILYHDGTQFQRLAIGSNGTYLKVTTGLPSWSTVSGGGDVTKVGTPVNNQVGVWTGDGTLEGDAALTFDTTTDTLTTVNGVFSGDVTVADEAYDATAWNGSTEVPTKNAIRDKIESMSSGSGITRSVNVTSGNTNAGSSASTDYVYMVAGAHTISLPAASGNTNLYTIKNNHSANITVDTVGAETIDGTASISLAPEESVQIMSNGTNYFIV